MVSNTSIQSHVLRSLYFPFVIISAFCQLRRLVVRITGVSCYTNGAVGDRGSLVRDLHAHSGVDEDLHKGFIDEHDWLVAS
jgi:hypothetical protein